MVYHRYCCITFLAELDLRGEERNTDGQQARNPALGGLPAERHAIKKLGAPLQAMYREVQWDVLCFLGPSLKLASHLQSSPVRPTGINQTVRCLRLFAVHLAVQMPTDQELTPLVVVHETH